MSAQSCTHLRSRHSAGSGCLPVKGKQKKLYVTTGSLKLTQKEPRISGKTFLMKPALMLSSQYASVLILCPTISVTFHVNNQVQHEKCLPGETVWKCITSLCDSQLFTSTVAIHSSKTLLILTINTNLAECSWYFSSKEKKNKTKKSWVCQPH